LAFVFPAAVVPVACGGTESTDVAGDRRDGSMEGRTDSRAVDSRPVSDIGRADTTIPTDVFLADATDAAVDAVNHGLPDIAVQDGPGVDSSVADVATEVSVDGGPDSSDASADAAPVVCAPATHSGSSAVTYEIDSQHTGFQPGDTLTLPLCQRWLYTFPSEYSFLSAPVIGNGLVYTLASPNSGQPAVFALDENTGDIVWGPVSLPMQDSLSQGGVALDGSQERPSARRLHGGARRKPARARDRR
jgi:hypothetical protein